MSIGKDIDHSKMQGGVVYYYREKGLGCAIGKMSDNVFAASFDLPENEQELARRRDVAIHSVAKSMTAFVILGGRPEELSPEEKVCIEEIYNRVRVNVYLLKPPFKN